MSNVNAFAFKEQRNQLLLFEWRVDLNLCIRNRIHSPNSALEDMGVSLSDIVNLILAFSWEVVYKNL